jgi:hypothetical protein
MSKQSIHHRPVSSKQKMAPGGSARPRRSLTAAAFAAFVLLSTGAAAPASAFDIRAEFLHGPTVECQGSGAFCNPLEVSMKFTNVGSEPTDKPYRVSLQRFNGARASGYSVRHGGSGALETIPVLQPGESVTLTWSSNRTRAEQYTFRPSYAPALNDKNNNNHRITGTFNVVVQN